MITSSPRKRRAGVRDRTQYPKQGKIPMAYTPCEALQSGRASVLLSCILITQGSIFTWERLSGSHKSASCRSPYCAMVVLVTGKLEPTVWRCSHSHAALLMRQSMLYALSACIPASAMLRRATCTATCRPVWKPPAAHSLGRVASPAGFRRTGRHGGALAANGDGERRTAQNADNPTSKTLVLGMLFGGWYAANIVFNLWVTVCISNAGGHSAGLQGSPRAR
ncbi:hypothetical protein HaLaN_19403 [Haematococcus lacustris]|uniref:Uncharacterized protein n=1 Tax=Haematococcus lacustris TaxID=44745 RepID=A0A699ZJ47_HAELA|nr:hypothetical protein HaLaN_19403 [Haematococcus lacustris]